MTETIINRLQPIFALAPVYAQDAVITWYDVVPEESRRKTIALQLTIYVWPLVIDYQHGTEKVLVRVPLRG